MIFENDSKIQRPNWFTTIPPHISLRKKAREWCKNQPSNGMFYYHWTNTRWWFELESDAVWFSLHWAGNKK